MTRSERVNHSARIERGDQEFDRRVEGSGFGTRGEAGEAVVRLTEQV